MNTDQLLDAIDNSEYLSTAIILSVLEHAISLAGDHPISGLLAALSQRIAQDDVMFQRTAGDDQGASLH